LKNEKFNYEYLSNFLNVINYEIYSKNGDKYSVEDVVKSLEKLDKVHDTIGNFYLISKDRKELLSKIFKQ